MSNGDFESLRDMAERRLYGSAGSAGTDESRRVFEELQIHHIELEMQNEELRKAQMALEISRARYTALFNLAPVGYVLLDEKMRITELNQAAGAALEKAPGSAAGLDFNQFVRPEDQDLFYFCIRDLVETGEEKQCTLRLSGYDGRGGRRDFHARITVAPIELENDVSSYLLIFDDMTEEVMAKAELESARDAAEAASVAKSRFLANMSHEIRTPMNGVLGMLELALLSDLSEEQKMHLRLARSSAESLLDILNDILDISKIEAGKLELEQICFDIRSEIASTMRLFTSGARSKGLELVYWISPQVPERLIGDPLRMKQIFYNLLSNAVKFTEKGEIIVEISGTLTAPDRIDLIVHIRDTGVGIPDEGRIKLFKSFSQVDDATSRKYGGTGLGLAITSQLIEKMGGAIAVNSKPGKGSVFSFNIHLGVRQEERAGTAPADRKVAVYDPHARTAMILEEYLTALGIETSATSDPREAEVLFAETLRSGCCLIMSPFGPDGNILPFLLEGDDEHDGAIALLLYPESLSMARERIVHPERYRYLEKPLGPERLHSFIYGTLADIEQPGPDIPQAIPGDAEPMNVLVAEDNSTNAEVVRGVLAKAGWNVTVAQSGVEAVELFRSSEQPVDIILMDIEMPDMDGLEATRLIRASGEAGAGVPIIAMTAYAMDNDRERCLAAGMNGYITKPIRSAVRLVDYFRLLQRRKERLILLVEDEPVSRMYISTILQREGFSVEAASTAENGLALARRLKPDLLIADLHLPGMSGFELVDALAEEDGPLPPVIIQSADPESEISVPDHLLRRTRFRIIGKPLTEALLMSSVGTMLDEDPPT